MLGTASLVCHPYFLRCGVLSSCSCCWPTNASYRLLQHPASILSAPGSYVDSGTDSGTTDDTRSQVCGCRLSPSPWGRELCLSLPVPRTSLVSRVADQRLSICGVAVQPSHQAKNEPLTFVAFVTSLINRHLDARLPDPAYYGRCDLRPPVAHAPSVTSHLDLTPLLDIGSFT
ncbi:uncharacterized protein LY79DRAFT_25223 [Colletotrichum navitas]|uniref:Uncharacterized protein n=1 Tax=Colletotrichum navitas TaxID=681940 RepID=A0AAD8QDP4_9PEZI|nr:uncharacterized protein LY79DRAFT_25223 [Colletotrichum navitas]KAK1600600.1 hypothetical protein LY79DRAFT_25223 [Colletotrichum navitas]